jgi:hypothetical protein
VLVPSQIEAELRERIRQFDPHVPVAGLQIVNEQIESSLRTERLVASLSGVFGGLATIECQEAAPQYMNAK